MARKNGMPWGDGNWELGHDLVEEEEAWWAWDLGGLQGTDQADEIYGYGGNDVLSGRDGNDVLDGGEGTDLMNGGAGDDTYYVDNVGDVVVDADLYYPGLWTYDAGYDTVVSTVDFTLHHSVERLFLAEGSAATDGTGNSLDNTIHGNSNENDLRGGGGRDWLHGNADNDWLRGEGGDDYLYGGSHGDSLFGGTENDLLDGGTGGDSMRGETGDDRYYVDNAADQTIELANEGHDKVFSSITFTLRESFEDLTLLDSGGAINGTGNDLENEIRGNDSNNMLNGLDGGDDIWGFEGEDTLNGGAGEDMLRGGTQRDTVNGGQHNDALFGDEGNDLLNGGADNDTLYGGADQDELIGGTGTDTMYGGTGNDIYWVQDAGDVVSEGSFANQGVDTVHTLVDDYTLNVNVENLVLESLVRNGTGNGLSNRINGNGLDNTINGGFGNDFLTGGGGADTFVFNTALAKSGPNIDTIWDFDAALDTIELDNSVFTALAGSERGVTFAEFRVGPAALDASDRIIYDNQTGELLYDADGTGAQAAVQFASLAAGLPVTQADFWMV